MNILIVCITYLVVSAITAGWIVWIKKRDDDAWDEHKRRQAIDPFYNIPPELKEKYLAGIGHGKPATPRQS